MGVSLHYQGGLGAGTAPADLLAELEDIGRAMGWEVQRIARDAENPEFEGVILQPDDDTESLPFLFDRAGRLRCLADLICGQIEPDPRCSYFVSVKTQFGRTPTHQWITGLLRYLKSKYLPDLEVTDEGGYWESGDAALLDERKDFLAGKIALLAEAIESMEDAPRDPEALAREIGRFFEARENGG